MGDLVDINFSKIFKSSRKIFSPSKYEKRKKLTRLLVQVAPLTITQLRDENDSRNTILHKAVQHNDLDTIHWLIIRYPSILQLIDATNDNGKTPMSLATTHNFHNITSFLRAKPPHAQIVVHRAHQFVKEFVERYLSKLDQYEEETKSRNTSKSRKTIRRYAILLPIASVMSEFILCGSGKVIMIAGTAAIPAISKAISAVHLMKADAITGLHQIFTMHTKETMKTLEEILVRTGFEVFSHFEQHLIEGFSWTKWMQMHGILVQQCVDRIMNCCCESGANVVVRGEDNQLLSDLFLKGKPKGELGNHIVIDDRWEVVSKSGLVIQPESDNPVYLMRKNKDFSEKFGFRKAFSFEEISNAEYTRASMTPWNAGYKFILNEERIKGEISKYLRKDDPASSKGGDSTSSGRDNPDTSFHDKPPVSFGKPPKLTNFIGRNKELEQISNWFQNREEKSHMIFVIKGFCGVGKSSLAAKYVDRFIAKHNSASFNLVWLDGTNGFAHSVYSLYCSEVNKNIDYRKAIQKYGMDKVVTKCYQYLSSRPTLVILDNAHSSEDTDTFLPKDPTTTVGKGYFEILVTSHSEFWFDDENTLKSLRLRGLSEQEAVTFLEQGTDQSDKEDNLPLERLARFLDYSPLALKQVCEFIRNRQRTPAHIIKEFIASFRNDMKEYDTLCHQVLSEDMEVDEGEEPTVSIIQRWAELFNNLQENGAVGSVALEIAKMLSYMAYFPAKLEDDLYLEVLDTDRDSFIAAVYLLCNYYVLDKPEETEDIWYVHGLVRKVVRYECALEPQEKEMLVLDKCLQLLSLVMKSNDKMNAHMQHLVAIWKHAVHHEKLIIKYVIDQSYEDGMNTFLHAILKYAPPQLVCTITDQMSTLMENDEDVDSKLKMMINAKCQIDEKTPFHLAILRKQWPVAKLFLEWQPNLKQMDNQGFTPAHFGAQAGNADFLRKLLELDGSVLEWTTREGQTLLHVALRNTHENVAQMLIKDYGADVAVRSKDGCTPLHLACYKGLKGVVKLLLSTDYRWKVDVNAATKDAETPLMLALQSWGEDDNVVALLREAGAL